MIPELHCIVRKIARDGDHFANFCDESIPLIKRCLRRLLANELTEEDFTWCITPRGPRGPRGPQLVTFSPESQ